MYTYLFPSFLKLELVIWAVLIFVFGIFTWYISRLPDDYIMKSNAQTIENKKRLGIKIYRI